ncbi:ABC-three component system middle component 8 [Mesorhizobium sp. M0217]|uniref:ABC-three component system middle component 8 n=1 Tax=unclassified Mesorhizobium TaxID=325217 RepID=UPI0033365542
MLTPRKHLDLNASLLRVAAIMLKELHRRGVIELITLRQRVIRRVGGNGELMFLPALNFLYLLGKVEYHVQNDTLEYRAD